MYCNWPSNIDNRDVCYEITRNNKKFNVKYNAKANGYRLPTEAEWEYAACGGERNRDYKFSGSNNPYNVSWFNDNSKGIMHKSGELLPNQLGLYDMSGNVSEWCFDYYEKN